MRDFVKWLQVRLIQREITLYYTYMFMYTHESVQVSSAMAVDRRERKKTPWNKYFQHTEFFLPNKNFTLTQEWTEPMDRSLSGQQMINTKVRYQHVTAAQLFTFYFLALVKIHHQQQSLTHSVANGERCSQLKAHASCKCEVYEQLPGVPYRWEWNLCALLSERFNIFKKPTLGYKARVLTSREYGSFWVT